MARYCAAMSQENLDLVRRVYEAAATQDKPGVVEVYDPDVEFEFSRSPLGEVVLSKTTYRGLEGLQELFRERWEAWDQIEDDCRELIEADDRVITMVTTRGVGRQSGVPVALTHFGLWSIQAGKVTSVSWFGTREDALEAAGLSE